jgi:hypothetical protein
MSTVSTAQPVRRDPPWWVVVLAIPLFGVSLLFAAGAGLTGVSLIDAVAASRSATHSMALAPGASVSVSATSAGLTIEAGPDGQVTVTDSMSVRSPTRSLARAALDTFAESSISASGGGDLVTVPAPENFNLFAFQLNRKVTIRMPAGADLKLSGESVAADIHDLRGNLDLSIGSGAIRLLNVAVSGSDTITATAAAIDFEGSLAGGSLDIETDSGAIRLSLPAETNASYDVATRSGALFIRPQSGSPTAALGTGSSLTGVLGSGVGTAIKLRARSGAITIQVARS